MTKLIALFLFLIGNICLTQTCLAKEKDSAHLKLIFAANMPDIAQNDDSGYSQLHSLLQQIRQNGNSTIFAFGGGSLGPSPMSSFDRGSHIIDILNTLEPDLMTARKREFSYFEDELSLRSFEAAFPIIVSNVTDQLTSKNLEGLQENVVIEKNGHKVGFMSIIESEVVQEYLLKRIKVFESRSFVEQQAQKLRLQGAEIVVMVYSKKQEYYLDLLDSAVIDIAINARSARDNASLNSFSHPRNYALSKNNRALIFDLTWPNSNSNKAIINHSEVELQNYAKETNIALQITGYNHRLDRLLNQKIGTTTTEINTLRKAVRTGENAFANFVTDIIRNHEKTDIGLINGGGIRGNKVYPPNTNITRRDIATELPFRSRITVVSATGQQIKDALEHGISEVELIRGRFPHVSGLKFSYSSSLPVGQRITSITHMGGTFDLTKSYTVATSDYIANGGDGYTTLGNKITDSSFSSAQTLISDIVILNIQKMQKIAPKLESRSVRVK
ncbi:bifunctional UDP-sugar hydrolase/5'-nucleotidase [Paraglaciecola sp. L3A3]|uniref:bifunctional metallophosphatase/5'-nucleotidase n=1 Tax=Paraglaciecola sp. L3A3 TaxID=2686358 RepID=UPI00131E83E3|nr:bifunctional metallophosphatase/5'-nucleotidase [Paraglaciecola sp. L3A3]